MARIGYYIFIYPLSKLPLFNLYLISDIFAFILLYIIRYRKKVVSKNIANSFPNLTKKEQERTLIQFYKHFTDILIEGVKNLSISKKELSKRMVVKNGEIIQDLFDKGKNVILVSGHFNNWEWLVSAQNFLFPHQAFGIGMPITSKFWDKKVNQQRQRFGMKVIHAKNYKNTIESYTSKPFAILNLSDQAPVEVEKSYWTKFLNQETPVLFGTEFMANEYGFSVVFFAVKKIKRGYYEIELKLITEDPQKMNYGEITEAHTRLLEKEIIENPANWLWSHKRWKRAIPENLNELKIQQERRFNERFRSLK
jgi:KDO2-lipid IV(A) lauroyltransferase